jgi:hypothetical protein
MLAVEHRDKRFVHGLCGHARFIHLI